MSQWINEPMNEGMDEWMDGWASYFSWLGYFFTERPLRWGTFSLSYFFSEQPRIWATYALCYLPANSFVASATQFFSSCSCYNAFSSLQLQSGIAQEEHGQELPFARRLATSSCNPACQERHVITHALLRAAVPMRFLTAACKPE